ncbi:Schwann cell myelin protein-like [Silurus asotus]|uniref:Schwann cell myelin protein-like n=1 Tax=Silurus asotus TaxID=30991 RepID=A0AAD5B890_SILAS|nr:Schwann cell myelin protein-like [Silurus asotus]
MSCRFTTPDPSSVTKREWYRVQNQEKEPQVLDTDPKYSGRVSVSTVTSNCELTLSNVSVIDSGFYNFRFKTQSSDWISGSFGVHLTVTGLRVTVGSTTIDGETVTLSCMTTCALSNNPAYIWYKNGQRVSDCKSASCSVAAVSSAVSYSCALESHDGLKSPPVYSPKNTRAVVLSSGEPVEGDSVTLSCSSEAKPSVHTYSWFKQRATADTLLTTGQNYSIRNISSQHSGLYYCTAHSQMGRHNSTPVHLDVLGKVPAFFFK